MEKPEVLYRGVVVDGKKFADLGVFGDIKPIYEPKKNEEGRDIVTDGNEYGIYMTTNYLMTKSSYGNPQSMGSAYDNEVCYVDGLSRQQKRVYYPQVGVIYEIDATKIEIKQPWIRPELEGHYNNGFAGEEWITKTTDTPPFNEHIIPRAAYKVSNLTIGADMLHDLETIEVAGLSDDKLQKTVLDIMSKRKEGYDLFLSFVKKVPENKRHTIATKMPLFKKLFNVNNGIAFADYSTFDKNDSSMAINYLMQKVYSRDKENIDIAALDFLNTLSKRVKTTEELEASIDKMIADLTLRLKDPEIDERMKENAQGRLKFLSEISKDLKAELSMEQSEPGE